MQQSGGSSGSQPQQGSPLDNPQGQPKQQEQTPENPEEQGGEKPDGKKDRESQGDDPRSPRESNEKNPQNQEGDNPPRLATDRLGAPSDSGEKWGELPVHVRPIFRAEGSGDMPARYRDWIDAYYRRLNRNR